MMIPKWVRVYVVGVVCGCAALYFTVGTTPMKDLTLDVIIRVSIVYFLAGLGAGLVGHSGWRSGALVASPLFLLAVGLIVYGLFRAGLSIFASWQHDLPLFATVLGAAAVTAIVGSSLGSVTRRVAILRGLTWS